MKKTIEKIKSSPVAAVVGAIAVYMIAKKYGQTNSNLKKVGAVVLGVVAGAYIASTAKAKMGASASAKLAAAK